MAGLRELRKHLKSIKSIGQLAGAMKTVATAKYSRINSVYSAYSEYAGECKRILERFGADAAFPDRPVTEAETAAPPCFVIFSGNRGLCGSYNTEILSLFGKKLADFPQAEVVTCGKTASLYCREKKIPVLHEFFFDDIPSFDNAKELAAFLCKRYGEGEIGSVRLFYQKFINMLTQHPHDEIFLPCGGTNTAEEDYRTIYIPDKNTVVKKTVFDCLEASLYSVLLESAAGCQAATIMAMRSAFDNSVDSADTLETKINRIRQGEVTADVIEISYEPTEE
ncbi:MAG: hypothetical protein E7487_05415 [Ruminococcaceae bacterium]|nr:hypothetical protein [Oscillospiraceae bacterium]